MQSPEEILERLMSISREDFMRVLPKMLGAADSLDVKGDRIRMRVDGALVEIRLLNQPEFVIASLRLPRLHVQIISPPAVSGNFMKRFDHVFQRGGG